MAGTSLTLNGLFFLTGRPQCVRIVSPSTGESTGWYLPLVERVGSGVLHRGALWKGTEGAAFVQQHADKLKPGCALNLELERLHVAREEVTGFVVSCELAPARWPTHADAAQSASATA